MTGKMNEIELNYLLIAPLLYAVFPLDKVSKKTVSSAFSYEEYK